MGIEPAEQCRADVAEVEDPSGAGGETGADGHASTCLEANRRLAAVKREVVMS